MSKKPNDVKKPEASNAEAEVKTEKISDSELPETEETVIDEEMDPIDALNKEVEELNKQLAASRNDLLRAYADTDNTRKRLIKEADTAKKYRFQSAALELLPVLDNMNMALAAQPESDEAATFVKGFEMIRTQLENVLQNEGVKEIEALNQPFDANLMQALMTEKKEGVEPGIVIEVLQKGYKLKDRMLRPALVKVSE
ncbi:nucleotide exchange factor GrpE [Ileibacterium valens]|uniref:Protein GrpE n=1 Tax=Ileibacterium valens TaxID=1862668 RepID=A0A1U7NCD6_9FIRM|nr:nucleotide exchange factor GrpE [Ileibacterium valens]OLU36086.1 nucleotide exchange factor GrpE [Ileibacterium valens]OLU37548.1 nucleotide exchange factor GrpE [Erysipelotrichaceae bacterium NYU-BL-F16]OLU41624.1 nucleotide exchange factor GrpE [Erysipelotrichaceae bacterium NYU-BL-E8]